MVEGHGERGSPGCGKMWKLRSSTAETEMEPGEGGWETAEKKDREELCPGGKKEDLSQR